MDMVGDLKQKKYSVVATDLNGTMDASALKSDDKLLLALGNEASGLSDQLLKISNHRLKLPLISKKAESLNVAVCGAICMYLSYNK